MVLKDFTALTASKKETMTSELDKQLESMKLTNSKVTGVHYRNIALTKLTPDFSSSKLTFNVKHPSDSPKTNTI